MRAMVLLLLLAALPAAAAEPCGGCHAGAAVRSYALSKHGVIARLEPASARAPRCGHCHAHEARAPAPSHYSNASDRAEARRLAVAGCGACHAPSYAAEQLAAGSRGLAIGEMKLREAEAVLASARRQLQGDALSRADALLSRMRGEHLRDLRLGIGHQSPDYQWWLGQAALDGALLRIKGAVGEAHRAESAAR